MGEHQNRIETRRPGHVVCQKQRVVQRQAKPVEAGIHMQRAGVFAAFGNRRHPEGELFLRGQNRHEIIIEDLTLLALPDA
ncbi:hypothetical protein D3C87_1591280 [compost metagenome]